MSESRQELSTAAVGRVASRLVDLAAAGFILLLVAVALARLRYPYELQWLEGAVLGHIDRVRAGVPVYTQPTLDWVPFLYPPLYYYLSAAVSLLTGPGFVAPRLLSLAATGTSLLLLARMVLEETGEPRDALLAAGLFAATYPLSGFWFDLGRVDALFVALLLAGIWRLRRARGPAGALAAGMVLALAALAKQTALLVAAPLLAYLLLREPRRALVAGAGLGGTVLAAVLLLQQQSRGWFTFYVFEVPGSPYHLAGQLDLASAAAFVTTDLLDPLPIICWLVLILLWRRARGHGTGGEPTYLVAGVVMIGVGWLFRTHRDADLNDLMPAYAALALLVGLAQPTLRHWIAALPPATAAGARLALAVLLLLQFLALSYNPRHLVPTAADRAAGDEIVALLRALPGEVYVPYHDYLAVRAGKRQRAHALPLGDVVRSRIEPHRTHLIEQGRAAVEEQQFAAILLDDRQYLQGFDLDRYYRLERVLFEPEDDRFLPPVSSPLRPQYLHVPR